MQTIAPYGVVQISDDWKNRIKDSFSGPPHQLRAFLQLRELPVAHPLLQKMSGSITVPPMLPTWWNDMLGELKVTSPLVAYQLAAVTHQQFLNGKVDEPRWKAFRGSLLDTEKNALPQSPSIAKILEVIPVSSSVVKQFIDRGSKRDDDIVVKISASPLDKYYMSNGEGWTSCMHYHHGGYNERLLGTFFDYTLGMAYVQAAGSDIWTKDSIKARCNIRVVRVFGHQQPLVVAIDRMYANSSAAKLALLNALIQKGHQAGVPLAIMERSQSGISREVKENFNTLHGRQVLGESILIPDGFEQPYMDNLSYYDEYSEDGEHTAFAGGHVYMEKNYCSACTFPHVELETVPADEIGDDEELF